MLFHATASGDATYGGPSRKVRCLVGLGFTGTLTFADGANTILIATNPVTGNLYEFWDIVTAFHVNPSTTTDICVMISGNAVR